MRFELERVSLRYRGRPPVDALRDVTLAVSRGERMALMGSSGSGKSSLLRVLAGLEAPTGGRVCRDGSDVSSLEPWQRGVGMVLQDAPLYSHLTLRDNVAHPLRMRGESTTEARRRAMTMLDRVELSARALAMGSEVSGGERRRAALARALVMEPALLLLDEPFAALEPALRLAMRDLVRSLCAEFDCACVHATHDGLEALALGTTLAVLDGGRLVDLGPPARIWSAPACPASARLTGTVPMNLVEAPDDGGARGILGVRPERVRVEFGAGGAHRAGNDGGTVCFAGSVIGIDSLGDRSLLSIRTDRGQVLRAIIEMDGPAGGDAIRGGDAVAVTASSDAIVRFPPAAEELA